MSHKSYRKSISKERLERYKLAFDHLNLTKHRIPEPSEAGAGYFYNKKYKKDKVLASSITTPEKSPSKSDLEHGDPDLSADFTVLTDEYLDQCIHEWATWLATQYKRTQLLRLNSHLLPTPIELPETHTLSASQHKEATTFDHGDTI